MQTLIVESNFIQKISIQNLLRKITTQRQRNKYLEKYTSLQDRGEWRCVMFCLLNSTLGKPLI